AMTGAQIFHGARAALLAQAHTPPDRHDEASNQGPSPLPPCGLVTTPLFHVSGLYAGAVTRLLVGSKTVWTTGRFNAETVMRLIEREKVTGWGPTGTMLYRVLHHPKRTQYDLSSLNFVGLGGSAIDPALVALARTTLPGATVAIGYGLTEGTAFSTLNWGDLLDQAPNSVGRPMPTVEVQIRDPATGLPVAAGEEGEVCLRGPMVMLGYWQRPELNRARLLEGRWLRTGDMGFVRDGIVTLCSRRRDLIIRGGENVHPAEIEHRIQAHPEVAEAAVVGVDSPEWGQEVKAIVVAKAPEQPPSQEALKAWVSARLASYKVPTHWAFVHEPLPRNASGKVMKHLLVDGTAEQVLAEPE
ncbi:MAG: fatty acid--CoA ligase family protein, partial [Myxococcota bacterium]